MWCDTITFLRTPDGGVVALPDDVGRLLRQLAVLPGLMWLLRGEQRCCCEASADGVDKLLQPSEIK